MWRRLKVTDGTQLSCALLAVIAASAVFLQIMLMFNWTEERFQPEDDQIGHLAALQGSFAGIDQVGAHYDAGSTISSTVLIMLILVAVAYLKPKFWRIGLVGIALAGVYSAERAISVIQTPDAADTITANYAGIPLIEGAQVTDPTQVPFVAAGIAVSIAVMAILAAAQPPAKDNRAALLPQHS